MEITADKYALIFLAILIVFFIFYFLLKSLFKIIHSYIDKTYNSPREGSVSSSKKRSEDTILNEENRSREWKEKRATERRSEERRIFNRGFFVRKGFFDEGFSDKLEKEDEFYDRREKNTDNSGRRKSERRRS